jgi:hypothetical protein
MTGRIALGIATMALVAASAARAVSGGAVIRVHPGDRIVVNQNLGCFVATPTQIVCGGAYGSHINAAVYSSGKIVIVYQPTPHGAFPALFIDRAVCNPATGGCSLQLRTPTG